MLVINAMQELYIVCSCDVNVNLATSIAEHLLTTVSVISAGVSWNSGLCKTDIRVSSKAM